VPIKKTIENHQLLFWLGVFSCVYVCLSFGLKEFSIWQQIYDVRNVLQGKEAFYDDFPLHVLRYFLVWPSFYLAEKLNFHENSVFYWQVVFNMLAAAVVTCGIVSDRRSGKVFSVFLYFFVMSMLMNGRTSYAIFGSALVLYALVRYQVMSAKKILACLLSGLVLSEVSSGTLFFLSLYVLSMLAGFYFLGVRKRLSVMLLVFLIAALIIPLALFVKKNLDYFGGGERGFLGMLFHGYGGYVVGRGWVMLVVLFAVLGLYVCIRDRFHSFLSYIFKLCGPAMFLLVFGMMGGAVGLSSMGIAVPALPVLGLAALDRKRDFDR